MKIGIKTRVVIKIILIILVFCFLGGLFSQKFSTWIGIQSNISFVTILEHIIGAYLFLLVVFILMRPSIHISDCFVIDTPEGEEERLRFKFLNYSFFRATDVKVYLYEREVIIKNGTHVKRTLLSEYKGKDKGVPFLERLNPFDKEQLFAFKLKFHDIKKETMDIILNNNHHSLEVNIEVKHGLSGLTGNFSKIYDGRDCIKNGRFQHGLSTKIIQ